eukprot:COSAG06_NODE_62_length_27058_cov_17.867725_19_plen_195_part_00
MSCGAAGELYLGGGAVRTGLWRGWLEPPGRREGGPRPDTLFCGPASIRFSARAHRPPPRSPSHLRRIGRAPQLAGSALRKRFLGVKVHPLTGLRFGVGDGLGGTARGLAGVHTHQIGHAACYPAARLRWVYGGHTDDRDERGAGSEQEELWSRYFGINVGSLPNVRLGQRTPPNEFDWKRYWDAAAEPWNAAAE